MEEYLKNLYLTDEYIAKHPSLHVEDSPWKVSQIIPLVDRVISRMAKDEVNLLDVGGGAGIIMRAVSAHIGEKFSLKVNKLALDLSPGMIDIQKETNPDIFKALNEDICQTSLGNKEIDLCLMIDVLEHIPGPANALEEIKRISNFVIFKVPLDDNLISKIWDFLTRGKSRKYAIEHSGHVNVYNFNRLKEQIEEHTGRILHFYFTDAFDYFRSSKHYKDKMPVRSKVMNFVASYLFKLSPRLCSLIFTDFVMLLVECYPLVEKQQQMVEE